LVVIEVPAAGPPRFVAAVDNQVVTGGGGGYQFGSPTDAAEAALLAALQLQETP
jgi:hypothetical protein